ncbi:HMCN1-like protein [Mya arenaria]|uniref:HMCN1-like protein n=1 Tax=Mya arenaria TaxID=6604 RepID=A0ABY7FYR7_MYAAR|nr:HMCN1-like protein [Mya arenaria]
MEYPHLDECLSLVVQLWNFRLSTEYLHVEESLFHNIRVNGHWSLWGNWTECSVTCGDGQRSRYRTCSDPEPAHGGDNCTIGSFATTETCSNVVCPVDGGWGTWESWSICDCENEQNRKRKCENPSPVGAGKQCEGNYTQTGGWTNWFSWMSCSATCGHGTHLRLRLCENPKPENGGRYCEGEGRESNDCFEQFCAVDGNWAEWERWGACDKPCNTGHQSRNRTCSNPEPAYGGQNCSGKGVDTTTCNSQHCPGQVFISGQCQKVQKLILLCHSLLYDILHSLLPKTFIIRYRKIHLLCHAFECLYKVNGVWGEWGHWAECDVTCALGNQMRNRSCDNPLPAFGGQGCAGEETEFQKCQKGPCPSKSRTCQPKSNLDGKWSGWGVWSECSVSCLNGTKSRNRTCDNPPALYNGADCVGSYTHVDVCRPRDNCDGTPLGFVNMSSQYKSHNCTWYNGADFIGSDTWLDKARICAAFEHLLRNFSHGVHFSVNGGWSEWSGYTPCDSTCGTGTKMAFRGCDNPPTQHNGMYCQGEFSKSASCIVKPCPVDGAWNSWMEWGACSTTCQTGFRIRSRVCDKPANAYGGKPCPGSFNDNITCFERECPVDGGMSDWSEWSTCSLSCGNGTQIRSRTCTNPTPMYGGATCTEDSTQDQLCLVVNCPSITNGINTQIQGWNENSFNLPKPNHIPAFILLVNGTWSDWAAWGACDVTCGNGTMTRSRSCDNPQPDFGGEDCVGNETDVTECPEKCCPDISIRHCTQLHVNCKFGLTFSRNLYVIHYTMNKLLILLTFRQLRFIWPSMKFTNFKQLYFFNYCFSNCVSFPKEREYLEYMLHNAIKIISIVDGNWALWYPWSECQGDCSKGTRSRFRNCNKPLPFCGGNQCDGEFRQTDEICLPIGCSTSK